MSMLSAQCDELRSMAESVGLAMPQAATLMMEAADTIWELRDSVHRERAEADRLREELEAVGIAAYSYGRGDLKTENAKLRELCKAWREFAYEIFDECFGEPELNEDFMELDDRMNELVMEVDE